METEMATLLDEVNRIRLTAYRSLLALSATPIGVDEGTRALVAITQRLRALLALVETRVKALHHRLEPTLLPGTERHHLLSARAVRGLVVMSIGAAAACGGITSGQGTDNSQASQPDASSALESDSGTTPASDGSAPSAIDGGTPTSVDSSVAPPVDASAPVDSGIAPIADTSTVSLADASDGTTSVTTYWSCVPDMDAGDAAPIEYTCSSPVYGGYALTPNPPTACTASDLGRIVADLAAPQAPCLGIPYRSLVVVVDSQGHVVGVQEPALFDGGACVVAALANETFPCLEGDTITYTVPSPLR